MTGNNVTYTYGTSGTATGRPLRIEDNPFAVNELGHWIQDIPNRVFAKGNVKNVGLQDIVRSLLDDPSHGQEQEVYFYHPNHLGSASWITDSSGTPIQHLQYYCSPLREIHRISLTLSDVHWTSFTYGEPFVNQRLSGYSERFTFTGKECDEETGYGYFEARYMDQELMTMWLSVDPMADKYPSISPYAYCAWNPVKLTDPNGREVSTHIDQNGVVIAVYNDGDLGIYRHSQQEIAMVGSGECFSNKPDQLIGYTLHIYSFQEGDRIDVGSYEAQDWMRLFEVSFSRAFANPIVALAAYAMEAGNGGKYDPKSYLKNGSQLTDRVYVSPRNLGNFAAGYFGRAICLSKERTLASFGAFQLAGNSKNKFLSHYLSYYKQALSAKGNDGAALEHKTYGEDVLSNYFQRLGYENIRTIDDYYKRFQSIWE